MVSSVGRTCPNNHVVEGDNLLRINGRNACIKCRKETSYRSRQKSRSDALAAYGGRCTCCGEEQEAFLVIDHVEGDGNVHRRSLNKNGQNKSGGYQVYRWLRDNGYPPGFQVLCANCNMAKERPGGCPHQGGDAHDE